MIGIDEILLPRHVLLDMAAKDRLTALEEVIATLRGDDRVANWEVFRTSIMDRNAPAISSNGCGVCLAHGRTSAVTDLVMAAGRPEVGIVFPEIKEKVALVFVVGIPIAMDSEYLRIVGALARICRDPVQSSKLLAADSAEQFVDLLAAGE